MALTAFADPDQEAAFQAWYTDHARRFGLTPSPDDPRHGYDFRNAFLEGYEPNDDGMWDYRASTAFAKTAGTRNPVRQDVRGAVALPGEALSPAAPTITTPSRPTAPLTDAQRQEALAKLDSLQQRVNTFTTAIDGYARGYVSPDEATAYRQLSTTTDEYARRMAAHATDFKRGLARGDQVQQMMGMSFLPAVMTSYVTGLTNTVAGAARLGLTTGGIPGLSAPMLNAPSTAADLNDIRTRFEGEYLGLPTNPIERAGYDAAFPWLGRVLGDLSAFVTVSVGTTGLGETAGVPRMLSAARGARGLAAINLAGLAGGALIGASLAPESARGRGAVEGAAVGLGGTAFLSSLLAGRPIGTPARLLRINAMADALAAEGIGGALRVAPRLTFGRLAMSGIEGAGFSTLSAMGQGQPVDKAIGQGVEDGLAFAGYDTAFIGLGRIANWLPIHARIAETWASTAEALKLPTRLATATGDAANFGLQALPGMLAGSPLGPIASAIGGMATAARAERLQAELAATAARLRSTGVLTEETVNKLLTGQWSKLSADEAEQVTKALTKDTVERATADIDPVLRYAIADTMGGDPILDNTELKAISNERGRVTQAMAQLRAQGILEIDPAMIKASRRLAELAERRNQILLEEVNSIGTTGAVAEKVERAQLRAIEEGAYEIDSAGQLTPSATRAQTNLQLTGNEAGRFAMERLAASARAITGEGRAVRVATQPATRILFRTNSTLLKDLGDSALEHIGIDARISPEGERALDQLLSTSAQPTGRPVAPAGASTIKRPLGGESGTIAGSLLRPLGGAALGGAIGYQVDDTQGAAVGALLGGAGFLAGERLLAQAARAKRAIIEAPRAAADIAHPPRAVYKGTQQGFGKRPSFRLYNLLDDIPGHNAGSTVSEHTLRAAGIPLPDEIGQRAVESIGAVTRPFTERRVATPEQRAAFRTEYTARRDLAEHLLDQHRDQLSPPQYRAAQQHIDDLIKARIRSDITSGTPLDTTTAASVRDAVDAALPNFDLTLKRLDEQGAIRLGALGPLATGAVGALIAPPIAQHLGLIDEEDSILTTSAIGFLLAAGLGYKALARDGVKLTEDAARIARFVKPSVTDAALTLDEINRVVGRTGDQFKTTIDGTQVSGRRLYWALPHTAQIDHTIATLDAWPTRTTVAGRTLDLPARRAAFERDLARFAPFAVTDTDWSRITDHFQASTQALGYTPAESMRLYKGWLGWMTTPLEQRARVNIDRMSLSTLGRDATNPFTSAAGLTELRSRATTADIITGPSQPLPRNYYRASNTLNRDGTPAASRIRALVDDIDANVPSTGEGTSDTIIPWWSAPGARGIAPTVRFYRYADRLIASGDPAVGNLIHTVTRGIFEATELTRAADDKDRAVLSSIFRGINTPADMDLVRAAVESRSVLDRTRATNPRIAEAAVAVRKFLDTRADQIGLAHFDRIEDYFPWVYNYRTRRELAELRAKGLTPTDINYPIDAPVPRHVFFNHLETRTAATPLGTQLSPFESLLMYAHGANRKIYMDQLLANITPETFQRIRANQPWIAYDLGRWLLDVVGVPGPGTMYVQKKVESAGLWLEKFPLFQRPGLAQEINERYFLTPNAANNLSRLATGWAYTSKIAWNTLSSMTNLSQQIINGGTEYGLLNVLTSSLIGGSIAGSERIPVLAPILEATVPKSAEYRRLLVDRGILSETSQRHFDTIALYEAAHGTNRAHLVLTGAIAGATAGAAATALLNNDRSNDDQLSLAGGALTGAAVATVGAAKSAIMRRALMRVRDAGTFTFNLAETWNRAAIGVAGVREARGAMRAAIDPAYATRRRVLETVDGIITGALGGAAAGRLLGGNDESDITTGAALGATVAAAAATRGESRTARTQRALATLRETGPIFENRIVRDQAKDALRPLTNDEVATLYAQMQNDITQFRIAREGRGYFLNTPHGQALGALQSYTLNQAEFVGGRLQSFINTANRAIAGHPQQIDFRVFRYGSFVLAVGSVYGALLGGSRDSETDPDYWVSRLGFGVMPLLHWNDSARKWEILSPTDMFQGPLIGDITRTADSYLRLIQSPDANASFLDTSDRLVLNLFPGAKEIDQRRRAAEGSTTLKLLQEGALESIHPTPIIPAQRRPAR
jgi:hypothetical protein